MRQGNGGDDDRCAGTIDPGAAERRKRILYVTPEIADYVKAGGLGEVSAALPRALRPHCDVRVMLPGYRSILQRNLPVEVVGHMPARAGLPPCQLGRLETPDGLVVYLVLCAELFDRPGGPYGDERGIDWPDNDARFARLSLAAVEMTETHGDKAWRPDALHLNDWPTALAAGYLAWRGSPTPSVLTVHNLAYQGNFDAGRLARLGIPDSAFRIDGVEFHGKLSFLKAGIYYASHVTTVSATYAQEITTPELGCGLDGLLRERAAHGCLSGITNGIDASWDPQRDPHLTSPFQAGDWRAKRANAEHVRESFGLGASAGPLFAIVSRLVHQKGIDLAIEAAEAIVDAGGQLVVTGRGQAGFESAMLKLAHRHQGAIGLRIGYEETEARRIYAGSDFLMMPSRFEPCGLAQMYAQRFGSLPIAHRTGGLADTIGDGTTGFLFTDFSVASFVAAIRRAFQAFGSSGQIDAMRRLAMSKAFDWRSSALRYSALY